MSRQSFYSLVPLIVCIASWSIALGQENIPIAAQCTAKALAASRALPQLTYECPADVNDYDERILKLPARITALRKLTLELESFTNPAWWQTSISALNFCEIHGSTGQLTPEEKEKVSMGGDFAHRLYGDDHFRLVVVFDPCYQAGYSGSNLFLLYRPQQKVFVTQLIDGYFSRIENSVDMNVGLLGAQPIIEISTGNSMPPTFTNYYFTIDQKTNKAVPKNLFKVGRKFTNEIRSAMLFDEPARLGLPIDADVLELIKNKRLVKSFSTFAEDERGKIESNGRKLRRTVYRWNGRFYLHSAP
ncbi:MAG TPA: hypothetical protein VHR36_03955 [Pyrinomonadaceae bacterium]|nr:hypothetical protein [Pyrinomonadaceae bacterium]